jgi:prophage regulatory protein
MVAKKQRLLRLRNVIDRTGISRSGLYLKIYNNQFPKSIKLSTRTVAWIEDEVDQWIEQRIEATRGEHRGQK